MQMSQEHISHQEGMDAPSTIRPFGAGFARVVQFVRVTILRTTAVHPSQTPSLLQGDLSLHACGVHPNLQGISMIPLHGHFFPEFRVIHPVDPLELQ